VARTVRCAGGAIAARVRVAAPESLGEEPSESCAFARVGNGASRGTRVGRAHALQGWSAVVVNRAARRCFASPRRISSPPRKPASPGLRSGPGLARRSDVVTDVATDMSTARSLAWHVSGRLLEVCPHLLRWRGLADD